jgi:hypothetical protein
MIPAALASETFGLICKEKKSPKKDFCLYTIVKTPKTADFKSERRSRCEALCLPNILPLVNLEITIYFKAGKISEYFKLIFEEDKHSGLFFQLLLTALFCKTIFKIAKDDHY